MPKEEWGVKRACPKCATRFYDLMRDPMTCPSCGASFSLESITEAGRDRIAPRSKVKPEAAVVADEADVLLVDEEEDVEVDDELLEEDDEEVDLEDIADVAADDDET